MRRYFTRPRIIVVLLVLGTALVASSCRATVENRVPVGELFPRVEGTSLNGESRVLPDSLDGQPSVLLVGYVQETQFDLDRWLFGLMQAEVAALILEVPTIPGLAARLASGWIDGGMRRGIPEEDWPSVVTVYRDAKHVVAFTGNENPRNGRILVLDQEGRVAFFHDRGYSAGSLMKLTKAVHSLEKKAPTP